MMTRFAAEHERRRKHGRELRDKLAHLVSEGWSVAAAGRELGISQQGSSGHWAQIKADLGAQAV